MPGDPYQEALEVVKGIQDLDGPNVNPACHTRLYTHGHRTERALVLLHGFTNCPRQFDDLGRQFFEAGWNVLIPRYPRHGYSDRLNTAIAELRAEDLMAVADRSVLAVAGLGQHVTVAGLSLGGILTGYLAEKHDLERAVLIAPMFGLRPIPGPVLTALGVAAQKLPNFYMWWNRGAKEDINPPHGYPRFATHAYAALFETGRAVTRSARHEAPQTRDIVVITNAAEPRLDNRFTYELIEHWRRHGARVQTFEFPVSEHLPHDLIDPVSNPQSVTERSYAVVKKLIDGQITRSADGDAGDH